LLKPLVQVLISGGKLIIILSQSLGFQGVEDLAIVDSRDKSVGNGADGFIKVCLSGECVESGLRGKWWILGCDSGLDRVEWDRK
jgi:hypothetical protein